MQPTTNLELYLLATLLYAAAQLVAVISADTKVLHTLSLYQPGYSSRNEVISLENAGTANEELVIKGNRTTNFGPANKFGLIFKEITEYIADRNGYHVHFRIIATPVAQSRLSPMALKSSAG